MKPNYLAKANQRNISLLETLSSMAIDLGGDCFVSQSIALRDRRAQSDSLRHFDKPVLVLCGAEEALCPPSLHYEIASLAKNSRLAVVSGAGHISTLERPIAVTEELMNWLSLA